MSKRVDIFDMDDTLLNTPSFSEFVNVDDKGVVDIQGPYSKYFIKVKGYFSILFSKEVSFKKSGHYIVVVDSATKQPVSADYIGYIQDLDPDTMHSYGLKRRVPKEMMRILEDKDGILVLRSIPGFYDSPETIGGKTNKKIVDEYNKASQKMIVTGRGENLRSEIIERLEELGLEYPNNGLYLFPKKADPIMKFKVDVILASINDNNWDEVHFYEDRQDWLEAAKKAVEETYPDVKFVAHHITNVKNSRRL